MKPETALLSFSKTCTQGSFVKFVSVPGIFNRRNLNPK